uniref:Uncharacterized protein n=1 Tax=Anguilla anguilla TaxID=7936 RepID=A0A0E9QAD1_ANGAN
MKCDDIKAVDIIAQIFEQTMSLTVFLFAFKILAVGNA